MERWRKDYEALFDVEGMTELERRVWAVTRSDIRVGRMGYRTKTIKSGDVLECEVYPMWGTREEQRAREALKRVNPEKIRKHNERAALKRIIRLMNTNFTSHDLHVTCTYAENPPDAKGAKRDAANLMRRIKRRRQQMGLPEVKYIYVVEDNEDGQKKRTHIHLVMSGGIDRDEIERLWGKGWCNADRLQPNDEGLAGIGRYFAKGRRLGLGKHERLWSCSKNLKKPKVSVSDTKLSNRRVKALAYDLEGVGKEITEKLYKGYKCAEIKTYFSDWAEGCFIHVQMIRDRSGGKQYAGHGTGATG